LLPRRGFRLTFLKVFLGKAELLRRQPISLDPFATGRVLPPPVLPELELAVRFQVIVGLAAPLPVAGHGGELPEPAQLLGLVVSPCTEPAPLADQALVAHGEEIVVLARGGPPPDEHHLPRGEHRDDPVELGRGASREPARGAKGPPRAPATALGVPLRQAAKHDLGDLLAAGIEPAIKVLGVLVENALEAALSPVLLGGKPDGLLRRVVVRARAARSAGIGDRLVPQP